MLATLTLPSAANPATVLVRSAEELRDALRAARERALRFDLSALDRMLRLDRRRRLLELQAAATWEALVTYLAEHYDGSQATALGEALRGSIGESVARNDAGPDGVPLSACVEAITLVTADGELRRADRQTNAALFQLALGGHGLIGMLYSVTLRIDALLGAAGASEPPVSIDLAPTVPAGIERCIDLLVPPEQLERVLEEWKALAAEHRVELRRLAVRKLRPESETVLRWARREWAGVRACYSMRATLGACARASQIERQLLDCVLRHEGSFPLAAPQLPALAQYQAAYPALGEFLAAKRRLDPEGRLQSGWYRRLSAMMRAEWPPAQAGAGAE